MDKKYLSKKWKRKREAILKRDDYMCMECKRYGITKSATMVHHINPEEKYPELFFEDKNLISLCDQCHNKMHNRSGRALTKLGIKYQKLYWVQGGTDKMTKIVFVVGAPCSGKTTYVEERVGMNDIVFDYDKIAQAMTGCTIHDNNPLIRKYLHEFRKTFLKMLEIETEFDTAWIITTEMSQYYYDYVLYSPEVVYMETTKEECLKRLYDKSDGRNIEDARKAIFAYYERQR